MASSEIKEQIKRRYEDLFGRNTSSCDTCQIIYQIVDYDHNVSLTSYRISESNKHLTEQREYISGLKNILEDLISVYRTRRDSLDQFSKDVSVLPSEFSLSFRPGLHMTSQIAIRKNNFKVKAGERLSIIKSLPGNLILIRNEAGEEGKLSVLGLLLSAADRTLVQLCSRLQVELLACWTDHMMLVGSLIQTLVLSGVTSSDQPALSSPRSSKGSKDLSGEVGNPFRTVSRQFETIREFSRNSIQSSPNSSDDIGVVLLSYRTLYESWHNYQVSLTQQSNKALKLFNNIHKFLGNGTNTSTNNAQLFRCYRTKFIIESVETREEITHIYDARGGARVSGFSTKQSVEAEQLTSSQEVEQQRIVIRAVRDVINDVDVSFDDAISRGIINTTNGTFTNTKTREVLPIAVAMNSGLIQVERITKTRQSGKTKAIGLITVKDEGNTRGPYRITGVRDASTAAIVELEEAERIGIIDLTSGSFINNLTNQRIEIDEAIEAGWVEVVYENNDETNGDEVSAPRVRTYAVSSVVDQVNKNKVDFSEAVRRGLIDRETGNYVNNLTGERVFVVEAIRRGFLKAKVIDDPSTLDIDPVNHVVVERLGKVKALVKGWGAVTALMKAVDKSKV